MDFVIDKMESGQTFRVLNILDDSNREAVAQEISMSMPAERVIAIMEKVIFINGSYCRAVLDAYFFRNIEEVRELTERWRTDYNENRPHEALGNMTPMEYKHMLLTGEIRSMGHSVPAAAANP